MPTKFTLTFFLMIAMALGCSDRATKITATAPATNLLTIHLAAKPDATNNVIQFNGAKFETKPILADADFVTFDAFAATFTLKSATALRLSNAIYERHNETPGRYFNGVAQELIPFPTSFLVKVNGQPTYIGVFGSAHSSILYASPTIIAFPSFLFRNETGDVQFIRGNSLPQSAGYSTEPRMAPAALK